NRPESPGKGFYQRRTSKWTPSRARLSGWRTFGLVSTPIILDCDPGIDDALAIAFATASPAIDLIGLTTVAGNVSLDKTTANALAVASFVGAKDVPVTPGAAAPLLRPALHAAHVHGDSGLG